jgi:hypothetical protein
LIILSNGADGPRSLGEAASACPTFHVLDWFHLAMRIQHVAQAVKGWSGNRTDDCQEGARFADAVEHVRWRLWHGQAQRALDLIEDTAEALAAAAAAAVASPARATAGKVFKSLSGHIPRSSLRSSDLLPFYHQYPAACCGDFLSLAWS